MAYLPLLRQQSILRVLGMYEEVRKMLEEVRKDVSRIRGISREEYLKELYDRIQEKPETDDGADLFVLVMIIVYLAIIIGAWIYAAYHGVITI